jgi:hypothetical protein
MRRILFECMSLAILVGIMSSCTKKKGCRDPLSVNYDVTAEKDDGSCEYAGLGGNTTLVLFPKHHNNSVPNTTSYPDTAFLKFNATQSPGTNAGAYDKIFVGEAGEDHIHCVGLKPGRYYIMVAGFDTTISKRVTGGMPYTLTQSAGEVDLDVAVVE